MKLFLDSGDIAEIRQALPFIQGVTTNPTLLKGKETNYKDICKLVNPYPVSVQVIAFDR